MEEVLSEIEKELFSVVHTSLGHSNLSNKEWHGMCFLVFDRSIVIEKADKETFVVVWDSTDYIKEAEKQLSDTKVYKDVTFTFNEKILQELVGTSYK